ncbi:hypothetical protein BGX21_003898 [Mortierella sp. AD011]|nr:hypothetical protein BGX20_006144 [Mortierella sp. AD010]KAF9404010.1 hypothetical protein BGX21_003898 [Mortierella sp. AD011]
MKFYAIVTALVFTAAASAQSYSNFTNCATGSEFTVESFTIAPYPLCIGQTVCATVTGSLSTEITSSATLSIVGKYLGTIVYTDQYDFCELMGAQGTPCPIAATTTSLTACVTVKSSAVASIPASDTITITNGDNKVLLCQAASLYAVNC